MVAVTTGGYNTAIGQQAMYETTTGENNTAVGKNALYNTNNHYNTGVGYLAGQANSTGSNNTSLGNNAQPSNSSNSNEFTLGNSSVTALRCQQTSISSLSDRRDKTDIVDMPLGLNFVNKLRPVKFKWDIRNVEEGNTYQGKVRSGFIAQELQEAQKESGAEFMDLVFDLAPEKLEAKQGNLIPVMVQAIKELSAEVEQLKSQINN